MASIYDIARIAGGDVESQVAGKGQEAKANLAQFKHQKEIIENINKAMKEAEEKAKKGKKKFGLGGSLLGGLLGMIPGVGTLGAMALSGLASGGAEKLRQKKYDPTKSLREAEKKYAGRKQEGSITSAREGLQEGLDKAVTSDAMTSALMTGMFSGGGL